MSNAERLEELIEQAERAHNLPVLRVQPTKTLLKAIDSEIVEPLEKRIAELEADAQDLRGMVARLQQDAETANRLITQRDARIAELEAQLQAAQQWRPIEADGLSQHETVFCGCKPGCTDKINIWKTNLVQVINPELNRTADIVLPDDIRLCRKVQP